MPDFVHTPTIPYDELIVAYFFLGGLSAGAFIFSVIAICVKKEWQPVGRWVSAAAPPVMAAGLFILWIDLGRPFRFWRLFLNFNPTALLSWGTLFLNVFFGLSVIYCFFLLQKRDERRARITGWIGLPFAVLVAAYTGALLMQAPGRVLWNSPLVPLIFLNGALMAGTAIALLAAIKIDRGLLLSIGRFLAFLIILELGLIVIEMMVLFTGRADYRLAGRALTIGRYAPAFLGGVVLLGCLLPATGLLIGKGGKLMYGAASLLVLQGVLLTRYIIVIAGQVL